MGKLTKLLEDAINQTTQELPVDNGSNIPSINDKLEMVDDPNYKPNGNFAIKRNGKIYWCSRSMTVSLYVYGQDRRGRWYVLASQRGPKAQNANGLWNTICGYLDYGETLEEAAARECWEETGVKIPVSCIQYMGTNSGNLGGSQDVSTRYAAILPDIIENHKPDASNAEEGEVSDVKWIPLNALKHYPWAYGQGNKIIPQAQTLLGNLNMKNDKDYKMFIHSLDNLLKKRAISHKTYYQIKAMI